MAYTEISIAAPSNAQAGSEVLIEITIKNISGETICALPAFLTIDGVAVPGFYLEDLRWLSPGQSHTWERSFIMPEKSVTIHVESWWENSLALHKDNEVEKSIALEPVVPPPPVAGTITRMELEYDETWAPIPVANIPHGQRGIVHVWGRNDMATNQKMGVYWFVADPDGYVAQEYGPYWEAFWTAPGNEQGFLSSRFNLDKVGKYTIWLELLMNPDDPQVVDSYIGDLCTVAAAVPEPQFRGFAVSEYTKR